MPQDMPPVGGYEAVQYKVREVDWRDGERNGRRDSKRDSRGSEQEGIRGAGEREGLAGLASPVFAAKGPLSTAGSELELELEQPLGLVLIWLWT
jgi:hypothetical protein